MTSTAVPAKPAGKATAGAAVSDPAKAGLVLGTLIIVAAVANLPLAMANVALPTIGNYFDASQTQLDLVAVGYSLGLACSVLWLGALGDRYGRKLMALLGVILAIPAALISGFAPSIDVLFFGRVFGGFAAGMAYPTTLSLIAALWGPGPGRTRSIALWAAIGGAISVCGPLLAGILLLYFQWPMVFFIVIPLAVIAIFMALRFIPAHVHESKESVDNIGGILSVIMIGTFVLALNFLPVASYQTFALGLLVITLVAVVLFAIRQRRTKEPLYDLQVAKRPTFWVSAVAGIIVFGSLMGTMFIGQQFLQDVMGYNTVAAGAAVLPAGFFMIMAAPRSAKIVEARGARFTLLSGYVFVLLGFLTMLLFWKEGISYWIVGIGYSFVGIGIGLAGTPASRSLTTSVPVMRVGMASGTADLQRDLGGAIFNSLFGALLATGYAAAMAASIAAAPGAGQVPANVTNQLEMSYAGAQAMAAQYPQYATQITNAAKTAFLAGDQYAYIAGIIAVLIGAALVFFVFPKRDDEHKQEMAYHQEDLAAMAALQAKQTAAPVASPAK
jgi:DHA2 family multidrug resistance protein-like MFS transporter